MRPSPRYLLALAAIVATSAFAQAPEPYPARPLKIVAPMAAGGGTDIVARLFAQQLSARLGQSVVVENRAGAGGQIGTEFVAAAPADGYTLLFASSSALTLPYLRKTRFELLRDFSPVGQVGVGGFVLVTHPKLPAQDLRQFLATAKTRPGTYTFGSPGKGSAGHLALLLLQARTGIEMVHVPFKSSTEIARALIAGDIDCAIDIVPIQKPQIDAKAVRGLATTGAGRDHTLPDLPTFNEAGAVPGGFEITFWYGLFLPKATPAEHTERVQREFTAVLQDPDIAKRVEAFGLAPSRLSPAEFQRSIAAETAMWRKIIEDNQLFMTE